MCMKVVIHDLEQEQLDKLVLPESEYLLVDAKRKGVYCQGCFNCWTKNPGECTYKDYLQKMGRTISCCEELWIISRGVYGTYSPEVKRVLDRSISRSYPFFTFRGGEIHHPLRFKTHPQLRVCLYGEITDYEKETAKELAARNCINLDCRDMQLFFAEDAGMLKEELPL